MTKMTKKHPLIDEKIKELEIRVKELERSLDITRSELSVARSEIYARFKNNGMRF